MEKKTSTLNSAALQVHSSCLFGWLRLISNPFWPLFITLSLLPGFITHLQNSVPFPNQHSSSCKIFQFEKQNLFTVNLIIFLNSPHKLFLIYLFTYLSSRKTTAHQLSPLTSALLVPYPTQVSKIYLLINYRILVLLSLPSLLNIQYHPYTTSHIL